MKVPKRNGLTQGEMVKLLDIFVLEAVYITRNEVHFLAIHIKTTSTTKVPIIDIQSEFFVSSDNSDQYSLIKIGFWDYILISN